MAEAGCVPDASSILLKMEEEQKFYSETIVRSWPFFMSLSVHLLGNPSTSSRPLECVVTATQLPSLSPKLVTERLLLRDASCFYHCKEGFCTCG
eukprot:c35874_g1_i1 orf=199-480(+)